MRRFEDLFAFSVSRSDQVCVLNSGAPGASAVERKPGVRQGLRGVYNGGERRKDFEKRKRVEKMTPEEMRKELLTDPLTRLGNKRAYEEDPRLPVQVFVDVDSLKWINDNISHKAGDELLRTVGWALDSLNDPGYRSYHISGDEFIIQAKDVETAHAAINQALLCLDGVSFEYSLPDGTLITKKGAGISYGIATTVELAEERLRRHKAERHAKGLRAMRGETPPGVARREAVAPRSLLPWEGAVISTLYACRGRLGPSCFEG
jgi:GGDEF domain-containing protein